MKDLVVNNFIFFAIASAVVALIAMVGLAQVSNNITASYANVATAGSGSLSLPATPVPTQTTTKGAGATTAPLVAGSQAIQATQSPSSTMGATRTPEPPEIPNMNQWGADGDQVVSSLRTGTPHRCTPCEQVSGGMYCP